MNARVPDQPVVTSFICDLLVGLGKMKKYEDSTDESWLHEDPQSTLVLSSTSTMKEGDVEGGKERRDGECHTSA